MLEPEIRRTEALVKVLIIEDEPNMVLGLKDSCEYEGYEVCVARDGKEGLDKASTEKPDIILLDVMLPLMSGIDVCRTLRTRGIETPIVMLTARSQETDKVVGLEVGADDYVTKPFSPHELRARIRALLRCTSDPEPEIYTFGDNEVDFSRGELRRHGKPVPLTPLEFRLLSILVRNRGKLLTRNQLLERVWGQGVSVIDRVVDNQILGLRRKIEEDPAQPRYLVSIRGMGYRFDV